MTDIDYEEIRRRAESLDVMAELLDTWPVREDQRDGIHSAARAIDALLEAVAARDAVIAEARRILTDIRRNTDNATLNASALLTTAPESTLAAHDAEVRRQTLLMTADQLSGYPEIQTVLRARAGHAPRPPERE